jgi:succinate dehydrogenase / fumarate reductase flavoprotein subunit
MQKTMTDRCSVFRDKGNLKQGLDEIRQLKNRYKKIGLSNRKRNFNYELEEALELKNMLDISETIVLSAFQREESRGAHYRSDFPDRNDESWLKHTLAFQTPEGFEFRYKPVNITTFQQKARKY